MGYATWTIGTEVIPHVREAKINTQEGTITLSCSALNWNIETGDDDPRDEIGRLQALTSQYINNEPLLNGGSKLQVGNGQILSVTDGTDTYSHCAVEPIEIDEDHKSTKRIDYDVVIHYELSGTGGSFVYTPSYQRYNNITYYMWTSMDNTGAAADILGSEIGYLQIVETRNVKRVEVYGSACCSPEATPSYLDINGQQEVWHYTHDMMPSGDSLPSGFEKLTFVLDTPATTLTLQTGTHTYPSDTCATNMGCWLQWIKVVYE